ncbi:MAG: hypothetical protein DMG59_22715 [Acidobacteria bacterium]|jgi:hypothetical protein|nr:MAG: hypothetical protein DMG59_22715 [Acidobacteriota bacterium]
MNTSPQDNYPQLCSEVGLDCETCTEHTARHLAAVCKGLRGKMVAQLFFQIHPHPACSRMHGHFTASYKKASSEHSAAMQAVA